MPSTPTFDPALPGPGTRVLVHGLGRFGGGQQAIRHLWRRGCAVTVADRSAGADHLATQKALRDLHGVDWQLGREDEGLLDGIDVLVVNPAVPDSHPLLLAARARGVATTQEVDLFLAAYPGRVVAVTGTNGKSTTATLLHAALQRAGASFAIASGAGRRASCLRLMAATAIAGGLDADAALRAITLTPAEILGVAKDTGSLTAGKFADVLVTDRSLFASDSHVLLVLSQGRTEFEAK
ncbi:MAG: amidohydrolase family protein [Planctomycetes bacterium]|nr:amidohydrolase family protein [Planctomycetota bacterium]